MHLDNDKFSKLGKSIKIFDHKNAMDSSIILSKTFGYQKIKSLKSGCTSELLIRRQTWNFLKVWSWVIFKTSKENDYKLDLDDIQNESNKNEYKSDYRMRNKIFDVG